MEEEAMWRLIDLALCPVLDVSHRVSRVVESFKVRQ